MSNTLFKLKRSAIKGKAPTTSNLELGELAINTNDGRLFFKTTDSASSSAIQTLREISGGTGITETNGVISITDTGTSTGEFGSSTQIPILTVNAQGQITAINETAVAGVSALAFDSANATLTISTADGGSFNARIGLQSFTTSDLNEGVNLYYTTARADSAFDDRLALKTTDNLTQGSTNLYYSASLFDSDFGTKTTDNLTQGSTNLYYDSDRTIETARHALSATGSITYNATTGVIGYSEQAYAGFDSDFAQKTTSDLTEGSNLYYTDARARHAVSAVDNGGDGSFSYDSVTGAFSYTGPSATEVRAHFSASTGIDITDGAISTTITQYTDADARGVVSANNSGTGHGTLSYDSSTGIFNFAKVTSANIRGEFSAAGDLSYNSGTGEFSVTTYKDADARGALSAGNNGLGFGALSYNNGTGAFTFDRVDSAEIRSVFSAGGDLSYDSSTGKFSFTQRTDSQVRGLISVTDAGGDGSLSYNNSNGVITYTGPSASETRAHFSGGTGVTITNGSIAIAQSVGTTDDVQFGKITVDSAQVDCLHLSKLPEAPNSLRGLLYYDSDPQKGLSFIPTTNELVEDVTINIGQEHLIYVHNLTGAQINNGDVVYISGTAHGVHPQVTLAKADASGTASPSGVATMDIPNGNHGYITKFGLVRGLNTAGMVEGSTAYLSKDSAGKWSTNEVSVDSGYPTHVGTVISVDGSNGSLLVDIEKEHFEYLRVQDKVVVGEDLIAPDIYTSHMHFDGKDPGYYAEGLIYYDSANGALVVKNDEQDVTLQVGQEELIRVYNNSGADITNGTPVYISGTANNLPSIEVADATFAFGSVGIATHTIENGSVGYVTARGIVNDVNTQSLSVGSKIHVGVGGGLSGTAPSYPYYPTDLGVCLISDSVAGKIYVDIIDHTMETLRVTQDARFDANVTIGGNLNILGVTSEVISQSLTTSGNLLQLLDGDTVGTAYQSSGGLNDATFKGKYTGDEDLFFFVRMSSVDSAGVGDVIEWGVSDSDLMSYGSYNGTYGYGKPFDSDGGPTTWNLKDDGLTAALRDGISIQFINVSGHDSADVWCAHPTELNLDLGVIGNYNQANQPIKYAGIVRDATDERWKFFDSYPIENIGSAGDQFDINFDSATLADIQFATAYGNLSGNASTATTATQLATGRTIGLTGNVTAAGVSFNGTSNISLSTSIANNTITNAMINASAAIADSKLATISTSGKVQNSATTATSANTGSTIVARDGSGNFTAGTITANLTGDVTGNADTATSATSATSAGYATNAGYASYADSAGVSGSAGYATNAGYASFADSATNAAFADSATNASTLNNRDPSYYLNYNNFTNTPNITNSARTAISVTDNGGDGSLSYDNGTGVITYTGPSASEVRAHFTAGSNIGITNGEISVTGSLYTDSDATHAISVTNSGTGYGSLSYNSTSGQITYSKVTNANIRGAVSATGDLNYNSSTGEFSFSETYSTANELLTAVKTVDGSGSGLDADQLDGQQGSYYRINVYNSSGTLLN
jgi:hypothetical protein